MHQRHYRAVIAALAALALATQPVSAHARATIATQVASQPAMLQLPDRPTRRVVLYVHGAGETTGTVQVDPYKAPLFNRLLHDGYAIAATDAHGDNWGTMRSVRDYLHLADWLHLQGLTRVYVLSQSMGGMDAMQLTGYLRPVAWAAIFPACNLAAEAPIARVAPGILASHPFGLPRYLSPILPRRVQGLRMLFWHSPQDTVVPKATNTDVCARMAQHRGAHVRVIATTGDHGDPSNVQPGVLARFYAGG